MVTKRMMTPSGQKIPVRNAFLGKSSPTTILQKNWAPMMESKKMVNQSMSLTLGEVSAEYFFQKSASPLTYSLPSAATFFAVSPFFGFFDMLYLFKYQNVIIDQGNSQHLSGVMKIQIGIASRVGKSELYGFEIHAFGHLHTLQLLLVYLLSFGLHLHVLGFPWAVDAPLTEAFGSAVLSRCKAGAIFFIAFGLFAGTNHGLLGGLCRSLRISHHLHLHIDASNTTLPLYTDLILSLEAFTLPPLALSVAPADVFDIDRGLFGLALIESLRAFEKIVIVIMIVVFLII